MAGKWARPEWMAEWMEPFARTIDAAKKYVVSSTLARRRLERGASCSGDLAKAVEQLKREPGKGLFVGGVTAPAGIGGAGIDRRVRVRRAPQAGGPRPDVVRRAIEAYRLEARQPAGVRLGRGGDAVRAEKVALRAEPSCNRSLGLDVGGVCRHRMLGRRHRKFAIVGAMRQHWVPPLRSPSWLLLSRSATSGERAMPTPQPRRSRRQWRRPRSPRLPRVRRSCRVRCRQPVPPRPQS